jgi:hypothetical protein
VTDEATVAVVRRLAEHYDDRTIAAILAKQKRRTATGLPFTRARGLWGMSERNRSAPCGS